MTAAIALLLVLTVVVAGYSIGLLLSPRWWGGDNGLPHRD